MIETGRFKNLVIFIQTMLSFVLSRKIMQNDFFFLNYYKLSVINEKTH